MLKEQERVGRALPEGLEPFQVCCLTAQAPPPAPLEATNRGAPEGVHRMQTGTQTVSD